MRSVSQRARGLMLALTLLGSTCAVLSFSDDASAESRPGGGGSYRGGGGSGGGSSRSSGGSSRSGGGFSGGGMSGGLGHSDGTFDSSRSGSSSGVSTSSSGELKHPEWWAFGFAALLLFVVGSRMLRDARQDDQSVRSSVLDAQFDREAKSKRSASIDPLRARDPALTEASILDRVRLMSDRVRLAWLAGDMKPARAFVSDGVFSRFNAQLALMREESLKNVMSDAAVLFVTIESVDAQPPVDAVHVRFTAQARDANVPVEMTDEQAAAELKQKDVVPYTEIWTLVRKHGAMTKLEPSRVGLDCPSCGAPLEPGAEMFRCKFCQALVCSGEHDWVLSEITQLEEWRPESTAPIPGLDALHAIDPGAAREPIEDRASTLFWTWVRAQRRSGQSMSDVAVGGADLLFVDLGSDPHGVDHAFVRVFWSARFAVDAEPTPQQQVLRLARKTGLSTTFSMSSIVCHSCGAPLPESDVEACPHCGVSTALNGQTWRLDEVLSAGDPRIAPREKAEGDDVPAAHLIADVADPRERAVLFTAMARLVATNGEIAAEEKKLLTQCAHRWAIDDALLARALSGQLGQFVGAAPAVSHDWFMGGLIAAALVDGTIDAKEQQALDRVAAGLGIGKDDLAARIASHKRMLGLT